MYSRFYKFSLDIIHYIVYFLTSEVRSQEVFMDQINFYEIKTLRKEIKHKLIDLDLDVPGKQPALADALSRKTGRTVHVNSLGMALTGYRNGPGSVFLLKELRELLEAWPRQSAS
jgi:hypothetical protein